MFMRLSIMAADFLLGHPYAPAYFLFAIAVLLLLASFIGRRGGGEV